MEQVLANIFRNLCTQLHRILQKWLFFTPPKTPPGIISTPKIGGGGCAKTHFFLVQGAKKKLARLLAPYAHMSANIEKHVSSRKKKSIFGPRGAIREPFFTFFGSGRRKYKSAQIRVFRVFAKNGIFCTFFAIFGTFLPIFGGSSWKFRGGYPGFWDFGVGEGKFLFFGYFLIFFYIFYFIFYFII